MNLADQDEISAVDAGAQELGLPEMPHGIPDVPHDAMHEIESDMAMRMVQVHDEDESEQEDESEDEDEEEEEDSDEEEDTLDVDMEAEDEFDATVAEQTEAAEDADDTEDEEADEESDDEDEEEEDEEEGETFEAEQARFAQQQSADDAEFAKLMHDEDLDDGTQAQVEQEIASITGEDTSVAAVEATEEEDAAEDMDMAALDEQIDANSVNAAERDTRAEVESEIATKPEPSLADLRATVSRLTTELNSMKPQ